MALRAVIFDFDGTIIDTETPEYEAWCAVYADYAAALPHTVWAQPVGTHGFEPIAYLATQTTTAIDPAAVRARHSALFHAYLDEPAVCAGIPEIIQAAREADLAVGIASSSHRAYILRMLGRVGLADAFDCVSAADDVEQVKPHPDIYLNALAQLGVGPAEAVAIEDSPNGVLAAQRAGIACVVVPNPVTTHFTFPDYGRRVISLSEITLRDCQALCG